ERTATAPWPPCEPTICHLRVTVRSQPTEVDVATQPTENLRIELLGLVRAWRANQELDLGSARSLAVFALLAMRAGQNVPHQEIITGVWGAQAPDNPEASLETHVSRLRRVLDPARGRQSDGVLASVEGGYCLRVDPDAVDVATFAR